MTDTDTNTEVDELQRLRELKTRLDMARGEGVSGSGFIRALGGHADGFESCQANDAIELLVPQLKRAIDAWQAERDEDWGAAERLAKAVGVECLSEEDASTVIIRATRAIKVRLPTRVQGPVERALREEWARPRHGRLAGIGRDINSFAEGLSDDGKMPARDDTHSYVADLIAALLDELGEPQPVDASEDPEETQTLRELRSAVTRELEVPIDSSKSAIVSALRSRLLPEGCSWPTYADGTMVAIGDRYVNISGDVRTVEYVSVAIGASALCSRDLDDDIYEPGEHVRRPAPVDTWDQLREDATLPPASYCDRRDVNLDQGWEPSDAARAMALDLVRRAQALAGGEDR